jgi:pyruvate ferredoxin oxidoreductase alpha subunit
MNKAQALTGADGVAQAMRQINPDVVTVYPITPQTPIMEGYAKFVADGIVKSELIRVESEHSALSAAVGSAFAGARTMTATSSAGLALMHEILGVASGLRCPIVMPIANRALSAPLNIHCDHSDTMAAREMGWMQIYAEDAQESYENTLLAVRLAEHKDILTPIMPCMDGFITSHGVENVVIHDDEPVRDFIGEYKFQFNLLDYKHPITVGAIELTDYLFETKRQQVDAMEKVPGVLPGIAKELSKITELAPFDVVEEYMLDDADVVIMTMSSAAGTTKTVVDNMRKEGKKVGLLKLRMFRPFPYERVKKALEGKKAIAVLDRAASYGAHAPIYTDTKDALYDSDDKPALQSFVFGIGGRDLSNFHIEKVFNDLLAGKMTGKEDYINLRE